jgi:16S rRNA (guanine527-N7)-methyltransferase
MTYTRVDWPESQPDAPSGAEAPPWLAEIDQPLLPEALELWQSSLGWQPSPQQYADFLDFYKGIWAGNQQFNLTRIIESEAFWEKHLWDSVRGIEPWLRPQPPEWAQHEQADIIDIGTGGGFPGIPLAIARPDWGVTLLDSTRKKIDFLNDLTELLELDQRVRGLCDRSEAIGQMREHRGLYDIATTRAVGDAAVCAEYTLPLLNLGGVAILYRGHWDEAQTQALKSPVRKLGGEIMEVQRFQTPISQGDRTCIYLVKTDVTPEQYPRAVGIPSQNPLR